MANLDIGASHREEFVRMLDQIDTVLTLDRINIDRLLAQPAARREQTVLMAAATAEAAAAYDPFEPDVALTGPPNHITTSFPLFEFKLRDLERSGGIHSDQYFPVSLSLLPNGRKVLKVYGLVLDTVDKKSSFERGTLVKDRALFEARPLVMRLIMHLIQTFPVASEESLAAQCRQRALLELSPRG